jgi:homoserine dehydrogenase
MRQVEVLKFGSSVLRTRDELQVAVDEIYRRWRSCCRILAVVSAFEGVTDQLIKQASSLLATDPSEATASYIAQGEQRTAALLVGSLARFGIPSRIVEPHEIGLIAEGTNLESAPIRVDTAALEQIWHNHPVLVLPGFYGIDAQGHTALFGRGGSDLSALFLAAELAGTCRLLKDVSGVYDSDPTDSAEARRFTTLSWASAIEVAGPLIQAKALRYAQSRALSFCVGRPNERACTIVGYDQDEWAAPTIPPQPLRIVLLGCGVVGRGVYEILKHYPERFEICHVVVGDVAKYRDIEERTSDRCVVLENPIDIVIECLGGIRLPYPLIAAVLAQGKFVVTPNKAVVAARWTDLSSFARGEKRQLWFSGAVGGALPVLETLEHLSAQKIPIVEIRGITNGTCGVVLDAREAGKTHDEAVALAKAAGYAEADPARDLSGRDSADKLSLMIESAFGEWIEPEKIVTRGIDTIAGDSKGYKLVVRARHAKEGITASVAPEAPPPGSFLREAKGAENRIEIELASGHVIRLRGQGAGRWPTAVSVVGDLHEIARLVEAARQSHLAPPTRDGWGASLDLRCAYGPG